MKRLFSILLIACIICFSACAASKNKKTTTHETDSDSLTVNSTANAGSTFEFGDVPSDSDGILSNMSYDRIKEKALQITSKTTAKDLYNSFGKYPNSNDTLNDYRYVYHCGTYDINMFGNPIATVSIINLNSNSVEVIYDVTAT